MTRYFINPQSHPRPNLSSFPLPPPPQQRSCEPAEGESANTAMASDSTSVPVPQPPSSEIAAEGPVLSVISKRLRALRKKHNRIIQMEESRAQGKSLNKEQEEVLRSKPSVVAAIDELEKLRQPLASALSEELSARVLPEKDGPTEETVAASAASTDGDSLTADKAVEDLVTLLYFGCLFDVKPQSEFQATMLTRTHERGCCLTYDYVTDDATDLLGEADLDTISALVALVTSRPSSAGSSHRNALQECVQHAKLWLRKADQPIGPGTFVTYAVLREKLNKILASDYITATPEIKAPVDVAAAVGKYGAAACQVPMFDAISETSPVDQVEGAPVPDEYQQKVDEQQDFHAIDIQPDQQSNAVDEPPATETSLLESTEDTSFTQQEQQILEVDVEGHNQRDVEQNDQHYTSRRPYQNQRGANRGGGRRGYVNGRGGGRGGRGGNNGYQSGRGQYYYSGYESRNYHNPRGRGGRSGGSSMYNNYGGPHGNHVPASVDLGSSA